MREYNTNTMEQTAPNLQRLPKRNAQTRPGLRRNVIPRSNPKHRTLHRIRQIPLRRIQRTAKSRTTTLRQPTKTRKSRILLGLRRILPQPQQRIRHLHPPMALTLPKRPSLRPKPPNQLLQNPSPTQKHPIHIRTNRKPTSTLHHTMAT